MNYFIDGKNTPYLTVAYQQSTHNINMTLKNLLTFIIVFSVIFIYQTEKLNALMPLSILNNYKEKSKETSDKLINADEYLALIFSGEILRPDPLIICKYMQRGSLTRKGVLKTGRRFKITRRNIQRTKAELKSITPYLIKTSLEILKQYPGHKVLFLGRDAEVMYDFHRLLISADLGSGFAENLTALFPASMNLCDNIIRKNKNKQMAQRFLASFGITKDSVIQGKKFLLIDSGFQGSAGKAIRKLIANTFHMQSPEDLLRIKRQFPITLIKYTSSDHSKSAEEYNIRQLFSLPQMNEKELLITFPKTKRSRAFFLDSEPSTMLADSIQSLPRFFDSYVDLKEVNGEVIALPSPMGYVTKNIDSIAERNISIVNPVAALEVMIDLIEIVNNLLLSDNIINKSANISALHTAIAA